MPTPLPTVYGGGGAEVSLLEEPGGGGGAFLKEDALEGDLDGWGIVRDDREPAVDDVVLAFPRPPPPPASALLDCTNRAGEWRMVKPNRREGERIVPTSADDSLGYRHLLDLL